MVILYLSCYGVLEGLPQIGPHFTERDPISGATLPGSFFSEVLLRGLWTGV